MKRVKARTRQLKAATKTRREEERRRRGLAILDAAKHVYSRKGFLGATIEDIAAEARVSVGTIYLYYKSKEDLYVSLLFEAMDMFTEELTAILRSRRRADRKVRAAWDYFYRFREEFPESYRVFFLLHQQGFPGTIPPSNLEALNRRAGRNFALATAIVEEAMESGLYRRGNAREVVDILWSLFLGIVHLSETRANVGVEASDLAAIHKRTFDWLENGLRTRP